LATNERYRGVVAPDGDAPRPDDEAPQASSNGELDEPLAGAGIDADAHAHAESVPDPDAEDEFGPEDFEDDAPDDEHTALPSKVEAWRKRSATGAILTGFALGLQQVFEKEREQPSIIMTTSGTPPRDLPVEAEFEHGRPRQSVVSIRPWLLGEQAGNPAARAEPTRAETSRAETSRAETSEPDAEDGGATSEDA
jgi:hypothetical protein